MAKFVSRVEINEGMPPWHVVRVPRAQTTDLGFTRNMRRVICTLNGVETFNCSLMPSEGNYFIPLKKQLRDALGLEEGDELTVELEKDDSPFGMPMPAEFVEVLRQDIQGEKLFYAMSPGNQRLMLKLVDGVKDIDKRVIRSLAGLETLKDMAGKFDYRVVHAAMKAAAGQKPAR